MIIQRFDLISHTENYEDAEMVGFPDGDYVLFTDHAAEVERLTVENKKYVDDLVNRGTAMINVLTAERDAAVARAEKAEEALRRISNGEVEVFDEDEGCNVLVAMDEEEMQDIAIAAIAAAPDHIGGVTEMVAPDKPQYAALAPEPWGGPDGEEE